MLFLSPNTENFNPLVTLFSLPIRVAELGSPSEFPLVGAKLFSRPTTIGHLLSCKRPLIVFFQPKDVPHCPDTLFSSSTAAAGKEIALNPRAKDIAVNNTDFLKPTVLAISTRLSALAVAFPCDLANSDTTSNR